MLYELSFNYWDDDPANDDEIILAVRNSKSNQDLQGKKTALGLAKERSMKKMISGKKVL